LLQQGDLAVASRWAQDRQPPLDGALDPAHEIEYLTWARVLLAQHRPAEVAPLLGRLLHLAERQGRLGSALEILILQALAQQARGEGAGAMERLARALSLAEPEGYIRSFVDEGTPMEALLYRLRKRTRKQGPTPYLDTLLGAFQQESKTYVPAGEPTKAQPLPEPLSERELQVLHLLARGASNLEIAQELVITIDTVKCHVSHIFSKLGVQNRVQAVRQARELGLLDEEL